MDSYYSNKKPSEILELNLIEVIKTSNGRVSVPIKKNICVFNNNQSTVILKYKTHELNTFNTFHDMYGDSIAPAIEEALKIEKGYEIDKKSGLYIVVQTNYTKSFGIPLSEKNKYAYVPNNWFLDNDKTKRLISLIEKVDQSSEDYDEILELRKEVDFDSKELKTVEAWNSLTKTPKT